jgi:sterol desaturase/sphingolipid hydroxylase (fatty acid hydroxylase superfamily)
MNGTRFHPLDEVPLVAIQAISLEALGLDDSATIVHNVFKVIHGLLQHSNVDGRCGPMNRVFSTAEQHRYHHARRRGAKAVNYGAVLSVWDQVFRTSQMPAPERFEEPIGIGGVDRFPTRFGEQLAAPFRWRKATRPVG